MQIVGCENLCAKIRLATFDKIPCLLLEHRVLVRDRNELIVAQPLRIRYVREVRIPGLKEPSDDQWLVKLRSEIRTLFDNLKEFRETHVVLLQESFRFAIRVDVDLRKGIVNSGILATLLHTSFEPRENQLQPVPGLDLVNEFIDREIAWNGGQKRLNRRFIAIHVEKPTDDLRCPDRVHSLHIYLNEVGEPVLV